MTEKTETLFHLAYAVNTEIQAPVAKVWALLTDAGGFARWNSTVTAIGGTIALGEKLAITVPVAPGRTFSPKVTAFDPGAARMVWSDGMAPMFKGVRTFTITPIAGGGCRFEMVETFDGVMLPMIKGSLPDLRPVFDTYAKDLKLAAEA